ARRLACTCMGVRNVPESAPHAQSSGTDANRYRVIAGDARVWWTWDLAALGRDNTPGDAIELPMRRLLGQPLSRIISACIQPPDVRYGSKADLSSRPD